MIELLQSHCLLQAALLGCIFLHKLDVMANGPSQEMKSFISMLSEVELAAVTSIIESRLDIWLHSLLTASLLVMLLCRVNCSTSVANSCLMGSWTLLLGMLLYTLTPKHDYIVNHLKTHGEFMAWHAVRTRFETDCAMGAVEGLALWAVLAYLLG